MIKCKLCIVSFGYADVIIKILKYYKIINYFISIETPKNYKNKYGDKYHDGYSMVDKNKMIKSVLKKYKYKNALFVDDTYFYLLSAERLGIHTYHIQSKNGISVDDAINIMNIINEYNIDIVFIDADKTLFCEHITSKYIYNLEKMNKIESFDPSEAKLSVGTYFLLNLIK